LAPDRAARRRIRPQPLVLGMAVSVGLALKIITPVDGRTHAQEDFAPQVPAPEFHVYYPDLRDETRAADPAERPTSVVSAPPVTEPPPEPAWTTVEVETGESLSLIFDRLGLAPSTLDQVMSSGAEAARLKRIYPGQNLLFQVDNGQLEAIRYEPSLTELLEIVRAGNGYESSLATLDLETRMKQAEARITSSLFVAGQEAGLSDNLIMQLAAIFGWDIDFALDIRAGDSFKLLFEQRFKDGRKVDEGPVLAAEFNNRGNPLRAIRYTTPDGITGYYSETGMAMRKAFLRTPLNFTRISSNFNLRRRHPVLNRIRAHRGVDYAAPTGTPVKAAGDGVVVFAGTKGGYGKTVILRHGGVYSTLYAHLSRYAGGLRRGQRVGQGAVIAYVGSTGLATGPHLHYEFQVNGIHRDPLNVPLPRAEGIAADQLPRFEAEAALLLAQLDGTDSDQDGGGVLAMSEDSGTAKLR
jgi:murein DD-endopeptidase MepM/ murein hydrolase activator NlpD